MRPALFCSVALVANAVVMSVEMLATRLLFPLYGNTVFTWSAVISIVIAGLFAGYMAGGWLADRSRALERLVFRELLASALLVAAIPRLCDAALAPFAAKGAPPLLGCLLAFGLPAGVLAATGPSVVGILVRARDGRGSPAWSASFASGVVSALAAAGSIAGTLLTTFALIPAFGVRFLFGAFGAALGVLALAVLLADVRGSKRGGAAAGLAVSAAVLAVLAARAPEARGGVAGAELVYSKDSGYQLVRVFEAGRGRSQVRMLMLDSTQEGAMVMHSKDVIFEYTRAWRLFANALGAHPGPRILFVGGGAYAMPVRVAEALPRAEVEVVEVDPAVEDAGRLFFRTAEVRNLRTLLGDGRAVLRGAGGRYDGVFVDAYQGVMAIPFHLTTREFFREVRASLRPGGVLGMNVIGDVGEREGLLCSMTATVASVFPAVRVHPIHGPRGGIQNVIITASPDAGADLDKALAGTAFSQGFAPSALNCRGGGVLTDDHAPVEWLASKYLGKP